MSDMGDTFRAFAQRRKENRARLGVSCPGCVANHPKRIPTTLMPGQKCKVCGHQDRRGPNDRK